MNRGISELIDEAIKLEHNAGNFYTLLKTLFPEDAAFWSVLAAEEKNHAALLNSGKKTLLALNMFPAELLVPSVQRVIDANTAIRSLMNNYRETPPTRECAFNDALLIEQSAGEIHFQQAMKKVNTSDIVKTFQQLNKADRDHIMRIRTYMGERGIQLRVHMPETPKK